MRNCIVLLLFALLSAGIQGQDLPAFELNSEWLQKIHQLSPQAPSGQDTPEYKILVFSLYTGYEHWSIPHTEAVVRILAEKSGFARIVTSYDISVFEIDMLGQYDAVVLNNTCPKRDHRDLFYDVFREQNGMPEAQRKSEAARLEKNLIAYVAEGGGIVLLHGGTTIQNNSQAFSEMTGGSFDFHPPQQPVPMHPAEPDHPLLEAFEGKTMTLTDEPYFFKNAYSKKAFRPLLYMETSDLEGLDRDFEDPVRYISWIKPYGEGRVFVCAPTHNAQNYENPALLRFLLDGIRYAAGQLKVSDTPINEP